MRSASIWVLPDPAPASTRMLVSSSSRIRRRDRASSERALTMCHEPSVRLQPGILQLDPCLAVDFAAAGDREIAVVAVLLIGRADELALDDHVPKRAEHRGNRRLRRRLDWHALLAPLAAGEVIDAAPDGRIPVARLEQFDRGQPV